MKMIFEKVADIIAEQLGMDAAAITESDSFVDTLTYTISIAHFG